MFRSLLSPIRALLAMFRPPSRRQTAALCWRDGDDGVEILLVTTRSTGRWTPPRGWPMAGKTLAEAAMIEAHEEAGAVGVVEEKPRGAYLRHKGAKRPVETEVSLFAMKVEHLDEAYREAGQRRRQWMPQAEAARAVKEPDLRRLISEFAPR